MATEADIPEPISLMKKVGENTYLARGQSDRLTNETLSGACLPETENKQAAIGPETMNSIIEGNVETAEGENFFKSTYAVEVASEDTCKMSKHCQDEEVPNQGFKETSEDGKQMKNNKFEVADETGSGRNEVNKESEEKPEKNDTSHDIENLTVNSLQMAEIEESNLRIGEEILEERIIDQNAEAITDQDVSAEDKSTEKETSDMHENEKDGAKTDVNTDLECKKQVFGILEATLDQNEASIHIQDPKVICLNKDVENILERKLGETSSKEVENIEAEKSTNLVGQEKSPEAMEPSGRVGNEKDEKEISMYDNAGDTPGIAVHKGIQSDEEVTLTIGEGDEEILYKPSTTLATDVSSIHETVSVAGESFKEGFSISCQETSQDKIEQSEKMKSMTQVEDDLKQKKSLDTFATQTEETCLQKVDSPELFKVTHEIWSADIIKEIPKEVKEQIEVIEKSPEDDSISSETEKNYEKPEEVAAADESSGENRNEEGSTVIVTKDNSDDMDIIKAVEHRQGGTTNCEERQGNLQQNEPEKEKLERSLSVVDEDFIVAASTEYAETITCIKEEAPIEIQEESFQENITGALERGQSGISDCDERPQNLQQNKPEKEKLEGSLSVVSTESAETNTCVTEETPFQCQEESVEEITKDESSIHTSTNMPQMKLNEKIECAEVEIPNKFANDLDVKNSSTEAEIENKGKNLDNVSNSEPEGQVQEAYKASTEEKNPEDVPDAYQTQKCTIIEHPSTEGGVATELILKESEADIRKLQEVCESKSEEKSAVKDSEENTIQEMQNNEEYCDTVTHELLAKSDDAVKSTIDAEISLEANSSALMRDEKVEQEHRVESPLEGAPVPRGEDESYKAEDNDKSNVTIGEVHDGTKVTGGEMPVSEQVIEGIATYISSESIKQETDQITPGKENIAENSEDENNIEQIEEENNIRCLIPASVEQDPVNNIEDEEKKTEDPSTGQIYENSKMEGEDEGIEIETSKTVETPKEIPHTFQVKPGQGEGKNLITTETSAEEKPQKNEPEEKLERPLSLMSDEDEKFSSDDVKIPCLMEEGAPQNLEENAQKKETEGIEENNDIKEDKIAMEKEDLQVVPGTSDTSKSTKSITLEPKSKMDNIDDGDEIKKETSELNEDSKDVGKDEETKMHDTMEQCGTTTILLEPIGANILQSSEEGKKEEETPKIEVCEQLETINVGENAEKQTLNEESTIDQFGEFEVDEIEQSSKEDNAVAYISLESIEQETIEISQGIENKGEKSDGENNIKQIIEETNIRGLIPESVEEVSPKKLEDEIKKAEESTREIVENSKTVEVVEGITHEPMSKTVESPKEALDSIQVKKGESLQSEETNLITTKSSLEEKPQKDELGEKLEQPQSLMSEENKTSSLDANKIPCQMEEGTLQNLEAAPQKEENEKEAEYKNETKDNKTVIEEDLEAVAETFDATKNIESIALESKSEMDNMVIEDEIKEEESKELYGDCKNVGKDEETERHDTKEECGVTNFLQEPIREKILQSSEEEKKEEETPKIEVCAKLETTNVGENAEKQTLKEESTIDQFGELEVDEIEQSSKEDNAAAYISLESIGQETIEISQGIENKGEKSDGENNIKQIVEETNIRGLIPESVEEVSPKKLEDEIKKAEESTKEIVENSKTVEVVEGITHEPMSKTVESPKEALDSIQVKKGESLQSKETNLITTKSSLEEKPQKDELVEKLEQPQSLMSEENKTSSLDANKIPCQMEEGTLQNLEETPQKEENEKEAEYKNETKDNKTVIEEDLEAVAETFDATKSIESIALESKSEIENIVVEDEIKEEESKELYGDCKNAEKDEETEKHNTEEEYGVTNVLQGPIGEKILQSSEDNKKEEETPNIEECAQLDTTHIDENAEKQTLNKENIIGQSREFEAEKIGLSSKEEKTVVYISSQLIEEEAVEISQGNENKDEQSERENDIEQIIEEINIRGLIPESVQQVPINNLVIEEKKAKETTEEILENSKMEEAAESIEHETSKTIESPKEILDTIQVKQGASVQNEVKNLTTTESSPVEKQLKDESGEKFEQSLSLVSDENETFSSDADKIPCLLEKGAPQNLKETPKKEENEKETEESNDTDNKIANKEDLQVIPETSDASKSVETIALEMKEMDDVVIADEIKKEESKESYVDCKDAGKDKETEKHDGMEECGSTNVLPEPIGEETLQNSEDKKEEEIHKIEACAQLETSSLDEDAEKQTLKEENIVEQSRELEVEKIEQISKEDMAEKVSKQEGCEITQTIGEDEDARKQDIGGATENNFEAFEAADSITSRKQEDIEEDTQPGLLCTSVEEETVRKSSKEDECKAMTLKEEVDESNSAFMDKIEVPSSAGETVSETLMNTLEPNVNSYPLDSTNASEEEAPPQEIRRCLAEKSTLVLEASNQDTKEEITAKEETTIDDSDSASATMVTEEKCLQEAETEDEKQVKSSSPASEEKSIAETETTETMLEAIDISVEPEDLSNLGRNNDNQDNKEEVTAKEEASIDDSDSASATMVTEEKCLQEAETEDEKQVMGSGPASEERSIAETETTETMLETIDISVEPEDISNLGRKNDNQDNKEEVTAKEEASIDDSDSASATVVTKEKCLQEAETEDEKQVKSSGPASEERSIVETETTETMLETIDISVEPEDLSNLGRNNDNQDNKEEVTAKEEASIDDSDSASATMVTEEKCLQEAETEDEKQVKSSGPASEERSIVQTETTETMLETIDISVKPEDISNLGQKNDNQDKKEEITAKEEIVIDDSDFTPVRVVTEEKCLQEVETEDGKQVKSSGPASEEKSIIETETTERMLENIDTSAKPKDISNLGQKNDNQDKKEEITAKDQTTIDDSDSASVTVVTEEKGLQEAETEEEKQVKSSGLVLEEKSILEAKTTETMLENIDISAKPKDISNSGQKNDKEIPTAADQAKERIDYETAKEVPHAESEDQNEMTTNELPLKALSEEVEYCTVTSKEQELMTSEASKTIDETIESQGPYENIENTFIAQEIETMLMQKQDRTTNLSKVSESGPVDTGNETANEGIQQQRVEDLYVHPELDDEKSLSISKDMQTSEREETRELADHNDSCISKTLKDVELSNLAPNMEKTKDENPIDEALESKEGVEVEKVVTEQKGEAHSQRQEDIDTDSTATPMEEISESVDPDEKFQRAEAVAEDQSNEILPESDKNQEDEKEIKEKEEPKLEVEDQKEIDVNKPIKAVTITPKAHDVVQQSDDGEDIKELVVEAECGFNELHALSTVGETTDKVQDSFLLHSEYTEVADSKEKTEIKNQVEEVSTRERERVFARESEEQKVQDSSIEPPTKETKEKIEEEITEESQDCYDKIDDPTPTTVTETIPGEAELGEQSKEVDSMKLEDCDSASKLSTKGNEHAERERITMENTDTGEPEEIGTAEAVYMSKGQGAEENDSGKSLAGEKTDQIPTNDHGYAEKKNVSVENSGADGVEETEIASNVVDETQDQVAEGTAEKESTTVVNKDQVPSSNFEHAEEDSFLLENPNADEVNKTKIVSDAICESKDQGTEESAEKSPGVETLEQVPATTEDAEKYHLAEEKGPDADEVVETKIEPHAVYQSKDQGTIYIDKIGESPNVEKPDADKSEEDCKETSDHRAQGVQPVTEEEITGEETPSAEKREEQLPTPTSALPFKRGTTTTFGEIEKEKTEKMEVLEDESPEDSSTAKPTEEISLQKDGPRQLEVSTLGLTTNKDIKESLNEVLAQKEEGHTPDGSTQLEPPENENKIEHVDASENKKIIDLTRPTETACNLKFDTSEKVLESELVIHRCEVLHESDDTEIKEKHLQAVITDSRDGQILSKKTSEANEITQYEVSQKEITDEKEVDKIYQPKSHCEQKMKESLQEDELKSEECTGEKTNKASETTVSGIQDDEVAAEDKSVDDRDQVSGKDKIIKDSFPHEFEGKDVEDSAIKLDSENQWAEKNFGTGKYEATTISDEESSMEISQKESIKEFEKESKVIQETQKSEQTSCATTEKQIQTEADIIECTETVVSTGNEHVPPVLQEGMTETSLKVEAEDFKPGNSEGFHLEPKEVNHGEDKRTDGTGEETTEESTLADSTKASFSDFLQTSTKETTQLAEDVTKEREPTASVEEVQTEEAETIGVKQAKAYEEKDEVEGDEHKKTDSCSDAPVMVEASRDMEVKVAHKKSHNILSGVGSKVKHSISKVKKVITGKSSNHPKPVSPK